MKYNIREISKNEYGILSEFLYQAIFIPKGAVPPPRSVILNEELQVYIKDFGAKKDDKCYIAEIDGQIIGAVWVRIMNDYGHIDDHTPSFAISIYKNYRGYGIGTRLMNTMLDYLKKAGYKQCSLSVQKANYAVKMYLHIGFKIIKESDDEYIMLCRLNQ